MRARTAVARLALVLAACALLGRGEASEPAAVAAAPIWLRVGLATDLPAVALPCCETGVAIDLGGETVPVTAPLRIQPAAATVKPPVHRLQVAALKDEGQAGELAVRLASLLGEPADAHFDAGVDLYRVRVGRFATRPEAEAARRRLPAVYARSWVVAEGGLLEQPALVLAQAGRTTVVPGRWLALAAGAGGGIAFGERRYRGRLLVYLNDRGSLNVINELPLEDYLRGVVPREMGPELYGRLESLKAQAVAARTYTLRNLGEFTAEGYDLCATPRCQVYGGMDDEHPLSDRAIAETAGQVLVFEGQPLDALYTSTCGGHTEDVRVVFPEKDYPYLRGVPCLEGGVARLGGGLGRGTPFPDGLTRALVPPPAGAEGAPALAARLAELASLAGLPAPSDRLQALDRREVQRFVLSAFDLALDVELLAPGGDGAPPTDGAPPSDGPPAGWEEEDLRRASYLAGIGLLTGALDLPPSAPEVERLLFGLALRLDLLSSLEARFVRLDPAGIVVSDREGERSLPLPPRLAAFRREGAEALAGDLALMPGDRLRLFLRQGQLLALVQDFDARGAVADPGSPMAAWTRFRSDGELAGRVEQQFPGLGFAGIEVLERGRSGRVGKLRLLGKGGGTAEVAGLAVRWLLDLPETQFTARHLRPADGPAGWHFSGRGWGHGVGLCQTGAYGMAGRGLGYRDILAHYYSGAPLARARPN